MPEFQAATVLHAPFERVWEFHRTVDNLDTISPGWLGFDITPINSAQESADRIDRDNKYLVRTTLFGIGIRVAGEVTIEAVETGPGYAMFRDVSTAPLFERWEHTHRFIADGNRTHCIDSISFDAIDSIPDFVVIPVLLALEGVFRARHRRLKRLFE